MEARRAHLRASLLDRLMDTDPDATYEKVSLRTQREPGLHESVRRDLEVLLSTRRGMSLQQITARGRIVHDYGVQDLSHLSPRSEEDRQRMASAITEAVEACEPRLKNVQVHIARHPHLVESLLVHVDALLLAEGVQEPVSFPFVVRR